MIPPPVRKPGCPPTAELEAHSAGEFPQLAAHVAGCDACGPYVAALRKETGAFLAARPPELFLQKLERRAQPPARAPWWRWFAVLAPVAAAAVLFVLVRPPDDGVTLKGEPFHVFLKRGEAQPVQLQPDASVKAGDSLRFSYEAPADGFIAVFDLDATEAPAVFYPWQGTTPAAIKQGAGVLPGSVSLDAQPGAEWLVAVFARAPFDVEAVKKQLAGQATRDRLQVGCEGCAVSTFRLVKTR